MKKLCREEFIKKCVEKHGNKYDYTHLEYTNIINNIRNILKNNLTN